MALYFFDIHSKDGLIRDVQGSHCDGREAIRREAMLALPHIAKDEIPRDGDRQSFTALVRDEKNVTVYTATLTFAELWLGDTPIPERPDDPED